MTSPDSWFDEVDPVIKAIVRKKLRVSLSERDDRRENQAALDVVQDIYQDLVQSLNKDAANIRDVKSYAAVVAYHTCAQVLRERYPERARLKNRIRYFLTHTAEFGVWDTAEGEILCGYAGWQAAAPAKSEIVQALQAEPRRMEGSALPGKSLDAMGGGDWKKLANGIFEFVQGPIELDEFVSIAGSLFGVKLEAVSPVGEPSHQPRLDESAHNRDMVRRLWQILCEFPHRWLVALLLNLPGDTKEGRGEIEVFVISGAASRDEMGRVLGLTQAECENLRKNGLPLVEIAATPEGRLGALWPFVPLEDNLIAAALECRKQQVINLRMVAIQKAAKRLKEVVGGKKT